VSGLDHLEPGRSYVFAANHQSIYDIPIVFTSIPVQLRIVAKESLGRIPFMGWHLHRAGHLLVDRRNPGADIVTKMARLVRDGSSLIVFPEGTRSVDGAVGRFKKGSFAVAVDARLPVVPVTITGSCHIMKKGQLMVCPGEVQLVVHPPISTEGIARDQVLALAERVRTAVMSA
jgi:1-acyl-sn-glycerol-3-phosphate acyltransferase